MSYYLRRLGVVITSANSVTVKPTGNIAATNVQAAIVELDMEKEPVLDADQKRKTTISTEEPTGGANGEIWLQYEDD